MKLTLTLGSLRAPRPPGNQITNLLWRLVATVVAMHLPDSDTTHL